MASIKVKFRPSRCEGKPGVIYYQVMHRKIARQISTQLKIPPSLWDENHENLTKLSEYNQIKRDLARLNDIVQKFEKQGKNYTCDDIVTSFRDNSLYPTFLSYMLKHIDLLKKMHKTRGAEIYTTTLNSFMRYLKGEDLEFSEFTSGLMVGYQAYLQEHNITLNTISFYMRVLRATYNRAVEETITEDKHPFKHVYTGISKTIKRALSLEQIKLIKKCNLTHEPKLAFARDMFLLSLYLRGMSFVDMAYLKKKDLHHGSIIYNRRKTGTRLQIKWEKSMQDILDCYPSNQTQHLFPIITQDKLEPRVYYRRMQHEINIALHQLSELLNLDLSLTMYVARHSWASIAKSQNIPISVISQGMGHDSEATTQIYLTSLESQIIDKANCKIIKLLQ